jgi:hypothetical protein
MQRWATAFTVSLLVSALSAPALAKQDSIYGIEAVSSHANLVSGGDVLLRFTL